MNLGSVYTFRAGSRNVKPFVQLIGYKPQMTPNAWMIAHYDLVPEGSSIRRVLDYSLKRWAVPSRYLDDGPYP